MLVAVLFLILALGLCTYFIFRAGVDDTWYDREREMHGE
jgi:hypothetical protein